VPSSDPFAKPNRLARSATICYIPAPPAYLPAPDAMLTAAIRHVAWSVPLSLAALGLLAGCADGPVPEMKYLNPWVRKQWNEDEQRVTTYHRKIAELAELRAKAPQMPPAERDEAAAQLAARLKEEKSPALRAEFVRALAAFDTPIAQYAVLSALSDEATSVRAIACSALGRHPTAEGFQALSQILTNDNELDVRIAAARELGKYRGFEAPKALRPALDDRDPALQLAAMQSLEALDGHREYRRNVAVWREHLDGGTPAPPQGPSIAEVVRQYWSWF
jgi:HEAT repeat protein